MLPTTRCSVSSQYDEWYCRRTNGQPSHSGVLWMSRTAGIAESRWGVMVENQCDAQSVLLRQVGRLLAQRNDPTRSSLRVQHSSTRQATLK